MEQRVLLQQMGIAQEQQTAAGTGHCHIELAVDESTRLLECLTAQKTELVRMADSEAIEDVVTLAALLALYGIDGNIV